MNTKAIAEMSLKIPNKAVKNKEDGAVVMPADMKMTGASIQGQLQPSTSSIDVQ